jgi:hypothetical protein
MNICISFYLYSSFQLDKPNYIPHVIQSAQGKCAIPELFEISAVHIAGFHIFAVKNLTTVIKNLLASVDSFSANITMSIQSLMDSMDSLMVTHNDQSQMLHELPELIHGLETAVLDILQKLDSLLDFLANPAAI